MTPEAQKIAIAEACGFPYEKVVPDYLNDLNAMHEAEKSMSREQRIFYADRLMVMCKPEMRKFGSTFATAAQRAEAFLKTLNLWKEETPIGQPTERDR